MSFPLEGNETVKKAVLNAITSGHFPHAVIIEGESGTGKSELAKFLAKALLCTEKNPPCEVCRSCHLAEVGSHPDLSLTAPEEKKKNITVNQVRELRLHAYQKPQISDYRIFIIDFAHTLNIQSQNALLKILEEPPGNTVFILLAQNVSALLPTVVSRCVVYSLSNVGIECSAKYLSEHFNIDFEKALEISTQSNGNIGSAIQQLSDKKPYAEKDNAEKYLNCIINGDIYGMLSLTSVYEKDRISADRFICELKLILMKEIRTAKDNNQKLRYLFDISDMTDSLSEPLKTNINLSLLFTTAAYSFYNIFKKFSQ